MKNKRSFCGLVVLSLSLLTFLFKNACSPSVVAARTESGTTADEQRAFVKWVSESAIPINALETGRDFSDISRVSKIIGSAQIVGLGEATHGSREIFQLKERIVEYLATQKGFSVLAIEANMPDVQRINEFILDGDGDPKELLKGLYWAWSTQEALDLILWMRELNQSGKGRVELAGFDMQNPDRAMDIVKHFVQKQEPTYFGHVQQVYAAVQTVRSSRSSPPPAVDLKQLTQDCDGIFRHLDKSRVRSDNRQLSELRWATQMARLVRQYVQMRTGRKSRDESMAENVTWLAGRSPDTKLALWAHNGHVTYDGNSYKSMGSYLKKIFGHRLVTFGSIFNGGSFRASDGGKGTREFSIGPAPNGSLDCALASAGIPLFALDLRTLTKNRPAAKWASEPHPSRSIGAVYLGPDDPSTTVEVPIRRRFDAVLFVNETSATRPN